MSHRNVMKPPWDVFEMPQTSMGWRMGGGEDYLMEWHEWFQQLNQKDQQAYIAQYPEPEDWFEFYHLCLPQNEEKLHTIAKKIRRLITAYCDRQYDLAVLHEEAEHYSHAAIHLGNIIFNIMSYQIWEKTKRKEVFTRYKTLKRHLVRQMAVNPVIRKTWKLLHYFDQRTRITLERTTVTAEDYVRIQKEIYFPSPLGRTWTKCFEDDTLYIHRHWNEPCLFLVILESAEQGYRITEAWKNNDPAIPRPLTRPPTEPDLLLTQLLGRFIKE